MTSALIVLINYGTDLSSRTTGAGIRVAIRNMLAHATESVTVDCTGIRTLSESFADELFGVLVAEKGKPWFRKHVQVTGMTDSTRGAILRAIDARLNTLSVE
ncbi:STAS-like domain-containing protein [Nannocystis sp.]|uniref:STAS-like domain-containing protein n=1 Tax=Nannocystis sp. TaxID=1962667 RepID=UPI0025E31852|nr:STAS-like domain-containing protein [Nannocystis sp.]MBK7827682.1 STAS-like domain-containing protein [Nannocystis sp.]